MKRLSQSKITLIVMLFVFFITGSIVISNVYAGASPVVGFEAGRIIDDSVFTNKDTLSVSQIQAFLNSKVPVCDTNGTQISEYGGGTRSQWAQAKYGQSTFACLKDYSENSKTSAQIIYEAAQTYRINPQVIITLLQKEQGLVTDTWPLNLQYRSATGYGCPDTAACDSQYYGLTNQINWSAKMFRAILNNSSTWYTPYVLGNNYIRWNPTSSCGGTTVNIANRSTQALYNYTPYQPNQAAINSGYGTGDGCSAYGNRNFYLYFTDWFGTTKNEVSLEKSSSNPTVYVVYDGKKLGIPSVDVLQAWGLDRLPTYIVDDVVINSLTDSGTLTRLVKNPNNPNMLLLADSGSFYSAWPSTIQNFGIDPATSITIGTQLLSLLNNGGNLTTFIYSPNVNGVFLIDGGTRHEFPTQDMLTAWAGSTPVTLIGNALLNQITASSPVSTTDITSSAGSKYLIDSGTLRPVSVAISPAYASTAPLAISSLLADILPKGLALSRFIQSSDSQTIYLIENRTLHGFTSGELLRSYMKNGSDSVGVVAQSTLSQFTNSTPISNRFIKNSITNAVYYLDTRLFSAGDSFNSAKNSTAVSPDTVLDYGTPTVLSCGFNNSFIQASNNPTIYMIEGGQKRPIGSIADLKLLNSIDNTVCTIAKSDLDALPTDGQIRPFVSNTGASYLLENGKRYTISATALQAFGTTTVPISTAALNTYTDAGALSSSFKTTDNTYVYLDNETGFTTSDSIVANLWLIDTTKMHTPTLLDELVKSGSLSQFSASQDSTDKRIFIVSNGIFIPVSSMDGLLNAGYNGQNIPKITPSLINSGLANYNWSGYIATNGTGSYWVLDNGTKRNIPLEYQQAWQVSQATVLSDQYLSLLRGGASVTDAIKGSNQSTVFGVKLGKKYGIPSQSTYEQSGLGSITTVNTGLVNTIQNGGIWIN